MRKKMLYVFLAGLFVLGGLRTTYAVEHGKIGLLGDSRWEDLGRRFGYKVDVLAPTIFDDEEKLKEYQLIIVNGVLGFTVEEYKSMDRWVSAGGILVLAYRACEGIDRNKNHKWDKADAWSIHTVGGVRGRCAIPQIAGAIRGGLYGQKGKIRFIGKNPIIEGLAKDEWFNITVKRMSSLVWRPILKGAESVAQAKLCGIKKKGRRSFADPSVDKGVGTVITYNKYGKEDVTG